MQELFDDGWHISNYAVGVSSQQSRPKAKEERKAPPIQILLQMTKVS